MPPGCREIVAIQPICNLLVIPPLLAEIAYQPIQQLLIRGIRCNPEISESSFYREGKKDVSSITFRGFLAAEGIYSTVTDLARLRGLSTSVPLINAA